jgi:hypothetical protein
MLSFTLCNILPLTLQIDQRAGRVPEPVWTQWRENAFLPLLGIEPRIPNRPACCVVTIIRCPLRRSACQADFSSRKAGFASRTVRVGFCGEKTSEWDALFSELFCPSSVVIPQKLLRYSSINRRKEKWPAIYATVIQRKEKKNCGHKLCDGTLKHALVILPRPFCTGV